MVRRPPGTRGGLSQKQEEPPSSLGASVRSRRGPPLQAWRCFSQKQDPPTPQSLRQKQERTPSHPRAWRRLSQKHDPSLTEPGDASVRSRGGDPWVGLAWRGCRSRVEGTGQKPIHRTSPRFRHVLPFISGAWDLDPRFRPARPDPVGGVSVATSPGSCLGFLGSWVPLCSSSALAGQRSPRGCQHQVPLWL